MNIASRELNTRNVYKELKESVKRFVGLKHFLETCASLLTNVNKDPLDDSLKKYVDTQMGFGETRKEQKILKRRQNTEETESAFMNDLMDLEWLVQRRITHSVKYVKLTTKKRGKSKEEFDKIE